MMGQVKIEKEDTYNRNGVGGEGSFCPLNTMSALNPVIGLVNDRMSSVGETSQGRGPSKGVTNRSSKRPPNERRFKCDECDRMFFTRKDVKRHMVVHTGVRNFACPFCVQRFGRKDHLVRHAKKSHNRDTRSSAINFNWSNGAGDGAGGGAGASQLNGRRSSSYSPHPPYGSSVLASALVPPNTSGTDIEVGGGGANNVGISRSCSYPPSAASSSQVFQGPSLMLRAGGNVSPIGGYITADSSPNTTNGGGVSFNQNTMQHHHLPPAPGHNGHQHSMREETTTSPCQPKPQSATMDSSSNTTGTFFHNNGVHHHHHPYFPFSMAAGPSGASAFMSPPYPLGWLGAAAAHHSNSNNGNLVQVTTGDLPSAAPPAVFTLDNNGLPHFGQIFQQ